MCFASSSVWRICMYINHFTSDIVSFSAPCSECRLGLAANTGRKKVAKNRHLGTIAQLRRAIFSQLWHISTIGKKNLLSSNISSTCPHNMVNFGPLAAEIVSLVWGTPGNFNGFRVLAALGLLHGILVVGVSQTAALNRGRHLYSAKRPSRWALAHILVLSVLKNSHRSYVKPSLHQNIIMYK